MNWINLGPEVINKFMLNSAEHEMFLLINNKMQTIVGILTFMNMKYSILGLSEPGKNPEFLDIFILKSIWNFMLSWIEHEYFNDLGARCLNL